MMEACAATASMNPKPPSTIDKALARVCMNCPVCRRARRRQRGLAYQLVTGVEERVCPFCRAYERVFGRKAHAAVATQALPQAASATNDPT